MADEKIIEKRQEKVIDFIRKRVNWITYIILLVLIWINI